MFLDKVAELDPALIKTAVQLHQQGRILPDTFVIDVDTLLENARKIKQAADAANIKLYFMLKQIGRNPYIARQLMEMGYQGAVVVDWKEAEVMMNHGIHIAHAGHLVQPPHAFVDRLVAYGVDYMTVYSIEKMREIDAAAAKHGITQKLLLRVIGPEDRIYSAQTAGFLLKDLEKTAAEAQTMKHVCIAGVDSFPCFLYDEKTGKIEPQKNLETVLIAKQKLEALGFKIENVNAPSTTSVATIELMKEYPITSGEPGHGLTGTTPLHAVKNCAEIPCVVYLTEVSHNYNGHAYVFGGGFYRRGHVKNALVGKEYCTLKKTAVVPPNLDSIDYHFELDREAEVGSSAVMAYRFQIFVTRSDVCLISGIHTDHPSIIGIYSSLGEKKN